WAAAVLDNGRPLPGRLHERGYRIVTGGTDTPLVLVDLRGTRITGDRAQATFEAAGIPCNKNLVPGDPQPLEIASGVRFGTSAVTTRGLGRVEIDAVAGWIADLLDMLAVDSDTGRLERKIRERVAELAERFPIYPTG